MRLGTTEIILIVVLALVLFGGSKLAGVGKALGKSIKDFKNEVKDDEKEQKAEESSGEKKA
jgi:sec-independent protein translocase protein TatA